MRGHARRVSFYAGLLAERVGLSAEDQEHVRIAAFLHDLGKVGVPTDLLLRAGALDPNERQLVEQHPVIGARLVRPLASLQRSRSRSGITTNGGTARATPTGSPARTSRSPRASSASPTRSTR